MALRDKSPIMILLGLVVLATATVTFRIADIQILNETIDPIANWVFAGGFVGIYLLSDREVGNLENYEGVSLLIPIIVAIGMGSIPAVSGFVETYNPLMGFALTAITLVSFYVLATNMNLTYVALELVLGTILGVTAALHYGIMNIQFLNTGIAQISVWVFTFTLAGAYLISERSYGTFSRNEIASIAFGIGTYYAYTYIPQVETLILEYNPISGALLTLALGIAYYVVMNNGEVYNV